MSSKCKKLYKTVLKVCNKSMQIDAKHRSTSYSRRKARCDKSDDSMIFEIYGLTKLQIITINYFCKWKQKTYLINNPLHSFRKVTNLN